MSGSFNRHLVGRVSLCLILILCSSFTEAQNKKEDKENIEFNFFRPVNLLKQRLDQVNDKSKKNLINENKIQNINDQLFKIITLPFTSSLKWATQNMAIPADKETEDESNKMVQQMAPLYAFLEKEIRPIHQSLGQQKAKETQVFNQSFSLGNKNYSGFTWALPMGHVKLNVNRQLSPDLFDDKRYIVEDSLEIVVDAQSFLNSMKESGQVDISEQDMLLFAGIEFKRTYHTYNYAPDLVSGLFFDFSKLFLPFLRFNNFAVNHMDQGEILIKEDYFNGYAGGTITSPNYYGMTASVTGMLDYKRMAMVSMQSLNNEEQSKSGQFLRISSEKDVGLKGELLAKIQGDFLNLLKITLFYYDLSYSYDESVKTYLSFPVNDKAKMEDINETSTEINEFLSFLRFKPEKLEKYVVSYEDRENENWSSKYGILIYANLKKSDSRLVHIQKSAEQRLFYKNTREATEIIENPWSKLIGGVIKKLLNWDQLTDPDMKRSRFFDMEVSINGDDLKEKAVNETYLYKNEGELSLSLTSSFFARRTTWPIFDIYKDMALKFIDESAALSPQIYEAVQNDDLKGPMSIKISLRVEKEGLTYFNHLSESFLFYVLANICHANYSDWDTDKKRREKSGLLFLESQNNCVSNLGGKVFSYRDEYNAKKLIPVKKLKNFLVALHYQTIRKEDYINLFGEKNVFANGTLMASTGENNFQTYFQYGVFKGLGIIDQYIRQSELLPQEI